MTIVILQETADQPDAIELLRGSDATMLGLYAPEFCHLLDGTSLTQPTVRFFIARDDGQALGCAAFVAGEGGAGELKRMYVADTARGKGVGRALLAAIEAAARAAGLRTLLLETGYRNTEALRLYRTAGYRDRGAFGDYAEDGVSVFMEKNIA